MSHPWLTEEELEWLDSTSRLARRMITKVSDPPVKITPDEVRIVGGWPARAEVYAGGVLLQSFDVPPLGYGETFTIPLKVVLTKA
jgi:hypothetical protein